MISAAPHYQVATMENRELEYLLLGDLRQILEEPISPQNSRWILAILDMILAGYPRVRPAISLPIPFHESRYPQSPMESGSLIEKLRRLRDRVAHRAGHSSLANEIRAELREVMLDRMSSAACLFDD